MKKNKVKLEEVFRACCDLQLEDAGDEIDTFMFSYITDCHESLVEDDCVLAYNAIEAYIKQ